MKHIKSICFSVIMMMLMFSCSNRDLNNSKSMTDIYKEEGVPVRVVSVDPSGFKTMLGFNSVLRGIRESIAAASMGGKVEKILVRIGEEVKKDQILLNFPTDSPATQYYQAKIAFENARMTYKRIENLYRSGGISLQDRDNAMAGYNVAKANWDSVRQMVKVKAPIGGIVTGIHVSETDNVKRETPLITISQTSRMKAEIWISEKEIKDLKKGLPATASWFGQSVDGTVVQVDMAMNPVKKAFRGLVEFNNEHRLMKAGTTVSISIMTYDNPGVFATEEKNILSDGEGNHFVYVVKNGTAIKRMVVIGRRQGPDVEIIEGLNSGDRLVVEGQLLLKDRVKVNIIERGK